MATTIEVLGEQIEVSVNRDLWFTAQYAGESFSAESRAELEKQLKKSVREHRVERAIACVLEYEQGIVRATLRRKHAGRSAYMFTFANGASRAVDSPRILCLGEHVTDDEIAELNDLVAQRREVENRVLKARNVIMLRMREIAAPGYGGLASRLLAEAAANDARDALVKAGFKPPTTSEAT